MLFGIQLSADISFNSLLHESAGLCVTNHTINAYILETKGNWRYLWFYLGRSAERWRLSLNYTCVCLPQSPSKFFMQLWRVISLVFACCSYKILSVNENYRDHGVQVIAFTWPFVQYLRSTVCIIIILQSYSCTCIKERFCVRGRNTPDAQTRPFLTINSFQLYFQFSFYLYISLSDNTI